MNIWPFRKKVEETVVIEEPVVLCPACEKPLVERVDIDGVYCDECGSLLRYHVAILIEKEDGCLRFKCPVCGDIGQPYLHVRNFETETDHTIQYFSSCSGYYSHRDINLRLRAPQGVCPVCWHKLARNGKCINCECERYQKPEEARMVPVYETMTAAPHCANCGQPFIVLSPKAGNQDFAEIEPGPSGWVWIAKHKGCSKCGAAFPQYKSE